MSNEIVKEINGTLPGDWWTLAAAFTQLAAYLPYEEYKPRPVSGPDHGGFHATVYGGPIAGGLLGRIQFSGSDGQTLIVITPATPASVPYWEYTIERLQMFNDLARQLRRDTEPTAYELVERFYRARAAGAKVTLKQLAQQYRMNYSYLRAVKAEYDKSGGWGSKVLGTTSTKTNT